MRRTAEDKDGTHRKIIDVASHLFRELGLGGAGVARIMGDAGLTHGGFYAHFASKSELLLEALHAAFSRNRTRWFDGLDRLDGSTWLRRVLRRYLNPTHRDTLGDGCPFAALACDVAREGPDVRALMEAELLETVDRLTDGLRAKHGARAADRALALAALCGGGVIMARAVRDPALSDRILEACYELALRALDDPPATGGG